MDNAQIVYTQLMPIILFVLMLGMGLSLTPANFRNVFRYPRAAFLGLGGQLVLLPVLAFALAIILDVPTPIAVGGMMLAACPGGVTSNGYVFVSRGDLGLSVSLTAITSIVTIFTIPLITWFALSWFVDAGEAPNIPASRVVRQLVFLTAMPIAIGMTLRHFFPGPATNGVDVIRRISIGLLIIIIVGATIGAWDTIFDNLLSAGILATCLNVSSMAMGYLLARKMSLPEIQVRTITFEVGVQNLSLAVLVAVIILERPEYAILPVVYAFVMKITALSLIYIWRGEAPAINYDSPEPEHQ